MNRRLQVSLRALLALVTASAVSAGIMHVGGQTVAWVLGLNVAAVVAGIFCIFYGARMTELRRGATWPILWISLLGPILIFAATCAVIAPLTR